jgi:polysaccharide export outer membrane protein
LRFRLALVGLGLGVALLAGCGPRRDVKMNYNPTNFAAPDEMPVSDTLMTYRLGPGDVVNVAVFGVDTLSGDRQVDAGGNLTMPLIGAVPAAGKSAEELGGELAAELGKKYLQQPQVTVTLKSAIARVVTVDGSVASPGLYPVPEKTTLLKTIAMAHGTSQGANPKKVVVFRQVNGQRQAAAFDLTTIRDGVDPDPVIYANDVVVVDGRQTSAAWIALLQSVPVLGLFTRF